MPAAREFFAVEDMLPAGLEVVDLFAADVEHDDRVVYFARALEKGTYTATYVARATTPGTFVRPPAHAEEMYNQSLGGRSEGGVFRIVPK